MIVSPNEPPDKRSHFASAPYTSTVCEKYRCSKKNAAIVGCFPCRCRFLVWKCSCSKEKRRMLSFWFEERLNFTERGTIKHIIASRSKYSHCHGESRSACWRLIGVIKTAPASHTLALGYAGLHADVLSYLNGSQTET